MDDRRECVTKVARRLSNKGRPTRSAFFCASSIVLMYSGTRGLFVQKFERFRKSVMTSEPLIPPLCLARSSRIARVMMHK